MTKNKIIKIGITALSIFAVYKLVEKVCENDMKNIEPAGYDDTEYFDY